MKIPVRYRSQFVVEVSPSAVWRFTESSALTLRAIARHLEAGLEKVYAQEKQRQSEETTRNQALKTALLDSLIHEIKTPLASLRLPSAPCCPEIPTPPADVNC